MSTGVIHSHLKNMWSPVNPWGAHCHPSYFFPYPNLQTRSQMKYQRLRGCWPEVHNWWIYSHFLHAHVSGVTTAPWRRGFFRYYRKSSHDFFGLPTAFLLGPVTCSPGSPILLCQKNVDEMYFKLQCVVVCELDQVKYYTAYPLIVWLCQNTAYNAATLRVYSAQNWQRLRLLRDFSI